MRSASRLARCVASICLLASLFALPACQDKANDDTFDQVKVGMSEGEVESLMGKGELQDVSGVSISGAGMAGGNPHESSDRHTMTWKHNHTDYSVTFQGGKVVDKSKF
ncbi:MAG: hypothetical protein GC200_10755 [Tepidisphaera sp.]|nr:hypothetical protein [Tepidisphaera sp.]